MNQEEGEKRRKVSVEVEARTPDEAIAKGLAKLGKSRKEVEIEILKTGSRGLLGFGAEDAVVRLSYEEKVPPAEEVAPPAELEIDVKKVAKGVLTELLTYMGIEARVSLAPSKGIMAEEREKPCVILDVTGEDLGILIGRRGETLSALQYITRLIVSRRTKRWANIIVDVEEYRVRRERQLKQLAQRMAERVALSHKPIALEAMPAYERRIIHLSLRDHEFVTTKSVGEGNERKVMIIPKIPEVS